MNKQYAVAAITFSLVVGVYSIMAWGQEKKWWSIENGNITLFSEDGSKRKEIKLESWRQTPEGYHTYPKREVTASLSQDGHYALIREFDSKIVEHVPATTVVARYFDSEGKQLWQQRAVEQSWVSPDGKLVLLIISAPEGCSQESDPVCNKTILSLDEKGHEHLRFGPYEEVGLSGLSPNIKYAGATVHLLHSIKTKYIFFETSGNKISATFDTLPGAPTIKDDGTVEFVKTEYKSADKSGPARAIKSEVVKKIRITK